MFPTILLAIFGLAAALLVTFIVMPPVIDTMKNRRKVGIDVHKLDKPEVAEMGGVGILVGIIVGCLVLFVGSLFASGFFDFRILIFLSVILLAGLIGVLDDIKTLGPKIKPVLTAIACLPILLYSWLLVLLGAAPPLPTAYSPRPYLPYLGQTQLSIVYPLLVPFAIAIPANAVNMIDIFNGVMPLTSILMFVALLFVSFYMMAIGIPGAELGVLFSCLMIGVLIAYYHFNRYPAKTFGGDTGSLIVGAALGATAVMGRVEIVAIIALLPAIMNAFYSLVSIGGLLERRQMRERPTVFQADGTLADSKNSEAPFTLTRLILARGPLTEKRIILSLAALTLASSVLAVLTVFLIPFNSIYLLIWPLNLSLAVIPLCLIFGVYFALRKKDHMGLRISGLISIMVGVWALGMAGFALLDYLIVVIQSELWPIVGILFVFGWLALWHFSTRVYYRYEVKNSKSVNQTTS